MAIKVFYVTARQIYGEYAFARTAAAARRLFAGDRGHRIREVDLPYRFFDFGNGLIACEKSLAEATAWMTVNCQIPAESLRPATESSTARIQLHPIGLEVWESGFRVALFEAPRRFSEIHSLIQHSLKQRNQRRFAALTAAERPVVMA